MVAAREEGREPEVLVLLMADAGLRLGEALGLAWGAIAWGESENKRKAKFYRLTASGRRQLHSETERWSEMTSVVASILRVTPEEV